MWIEWEGRTSQHGDSPVAMVSREELYSSSRATLRNKKLYSRWGIENCTVDEESKTIHSTAEWQLHQATFQLLMQTFGMCDVDLFATCLNSQLEKFVS